MPSDAGEWKINEALGEAIHCPFIGVASGTGSQELKQELLERIKPLAKVVGRNVWPLSMNVDVTLWLKASNDDEASVCV